MGGNPVPVGTERQLPDGTVEKFQGKGPGNRWTNVSKPEPTGIGLTKEDASFTSAQLLPALFSPLLRPAAVQLQNADIGAVNARIDDIREVPFSDAEVASATISQSTDDDNSGVGQI